MTQCEWESLETVVGLRVYGNRKAPNRTVVARCHDEASHVFFSKGSVDPTRAPVKEVCDAHAEHMRGMGWEEV